MIKIKNSRKFGAASMAGMTAATIMLPTAFGADWARWGGNDPGRNMYSPATGLPAQFNAGKYKKGSEEVDPATTKNVKWAATLGSQAFGNVVVANGKVFIGTNNEHPRDPDFVGDYIILMCLDEKSGDLLWQLVVPKLTSGKVND